MVGQRSSAAKQVVEVDGHRITRVRLHEPVTTPVDDAGEGRASAQQDAFASYFAAWGLFLPDEAVTTRTDGHVKGGGWSVRFRWRQDGS